MWNEFQQDPQGDTLQYGLLNTTLTQKKFTCISKINSEIKFNNCEDFHKVQAVLTSNQISLKKKKKKEEKCRSTA